MVIDKTTGRGFALSITSKAIAKELIADGIVDKTIYRKQRVHSKSNYDLFQVVRLEHEEGVYVRLQRGGELAEEPLWTPSFIDAGIWAQAVSRFPTFERLDKCVEKHLLPEMDEYLQGVSDAELISTTRDFLIEHGVINKPIRQRAGKTYYLREINILDTGKLIAYNECAINLRKIHFNLRVSSRGEFENIVKKSLIKKNHGGGDYEQKE